MIPEGGDVCGATIGNNRWRRVWGNSSTINERSRGVDKEGEESLVGLECAFEKRAVSILFRG